jgi:hypothetical protein
LGFPQIIPLGPAPDLQNLDPLFNPMVHPNIFLSGVALDWNTDTSSFTLDINVWVSASKDSAKPSFKPTAWFHCIIPTLVQSEWQTDSLQLSICVGLWQ